jgi:hypothetical protein
MLRRFLFIAGSIALTATLAAAEERARVEIEANFWDPSLSGRVRVVEGGIGDDIDLESDLGLASDNVAELRLSFHPSRRTEIRLARLPLSYSGDSIVSRTIEFAGETFTLSTRVLSELELDYVRLGFAWQFLSTDDGRFRAGPLLEVKGFDGTASLAGPELDIPVTVAEDFEAAFGSAGIAVDLEPNDRVHFFAEYSVLVGADEGDQTDLEAGVRVMLWGPLTVQAGYRSIEIDVTDDDDRVDFDIDGVFFGAGLRF